MAVISVIQKTIPEQRAVILIVGQKKILVAPSPVSSAPPTPGSGGTRGHGNA